MKPALLCTVPVILALAACNGGGAQEAGPVPTAPAPTSSESKTTTSPAPPPGNLAGTSTSSTALCSEERAAVEIASQEGAAGTIRTLWRIRNTGEESCRTFGYPGMDFRASSGWLDVQVHRGGMQDIDEAPMRVIVPAGGSLYFVSYWSDVDTDAGPCEQFDRVKVTLPDNFDSVRLASSGCLNPQTVRVGPVRSTPPA